MPKQAGITVSQRRALCLHATQNPHLRQNQLKEWFETSFQRLITQPSISESLSTNYRHLDAEATFTQPNQQRTRQLKWPELDKALFDWQKEKEKRITVTGDLIKQQAVRF